MEPQKKRKDDKFLDNNAPLLTLKRQDFSPNKIFSTDFFGPDTEPEP
jgi:hypothetical protein